MPKFSSREGTGSRLLATVPTTELAAETAMEAAPLPPSSGRAAVWSRRQFLRTAALGGALMGTGAANAPRQGPPPPGAPLDAATLKRIAAARPLRGGLIPVDLSRRLATAHVSGRYHFTAKPFLQEGAERVHALGLGGIKLWFDAIERAYRFNSDWRLPADASYVDLARHDYFRAAFEVPFSVIALELYDVPLPGRRKPKGHMIDPDSDFRADESQTYDLACHLLRTYRDRDVTFLLQNWEGDWMFRGGTSNDWLKGSYPDLERRIDAFVRWFTARQRGVERARAEAVSGRCRVFHAVEVNRVFDLKAGHPTVTSHVLPNLRPDFISWSCYDGLRTDKRDGDLTGQAMTEGLNLIQHYARTVQVDAEGRPAVFIGEIGFPEQVVPAAAVVDMMDGAMGALLDRQIPYIFHWELYCNERRDGARVPVTGAERADELRGFWLVRPDGTLGHTAEYLRSLLAHAGRRLPIRAG